MDTVTSPNVDHARDADGREQSNRAQIENESSISQDGNHEKDHSRALDPVPVIGLLGVPGSDNMPSSNQDVSSGEQSLSVPEQRRLSVVSGVSSPSPSPANSQEGHRSVSPAEPADTHDEAVPSYRPGVPLSKEEEAAADRQGSEEGGFQDPLPSYEAAPRSENGPRWSRIGPDAQIVPVTDLSRQRRQEGLNATDRPFSFDGSEYLNQAMHADDKKQPLQSPPSMPLSPISQQLSKSVSQVSAEEVADDQEGHRQAPRSFSRPFGSDPSKDHPALRQPDEAIDRSRMYSSESPLPSARRPQQEYENVRRPSPAPVAVAETPEDGVYRIPGPHFQELRQQRRSSAQNSPTIQQFRQTYGNGQVNGQVNGMAQKPQYEQQPQSPPLSQQQYQQKQQPVASPPPVPETVPKRPKFGGFFSSRSKSRQDSEPVAGEKQRGKLSRQNTSRQNSVRSQQSSMNENRDVVGQMRPIDQSKRRMSRDLMRSTTPTEQNEPRKKRFSGFFSRPNKAETTAQPQRSSTLPTNAAGPSRNNEYPQPPQESHFDQARQPPPDGNFYPQQEQSRVVSPPPEGYYAPPGQQRVNNSASNRQSHGQSYQQAMDPNHQQYDARPSDLRIDTATQGRSSPGVRAPATTPPHSHAARDISYQNQPYEHQPSLARVQSPPMTGSASQSPHPHVASLHKRARSPKLGRPESPDDRRHLSPSPAGGEGSTPVGGLGTFHNKKSEFDQEAPYRIDIPGGELNEEERKRRTRQSMIEKGGMNNNQVASPTATGSQTVAERLMGPQLPASGVKRPVSPVRQHASQRDINDGRRRFVAELPGSKAAGYESEEEIPMSATAYPGQWQDPVFFGEGRWDD